jgi:hypothetical protein
MFDNEHLKRTINSIVYLRLRAHRIKLRHILANYLTLFLSCFIQPQQNTIVIIKIIIIITKIIMHYQISKPRIKRNAIGFKILRTYYIVNNSILDYDI